MAAARRMEDAPVKTRDLEQTLRDDPNSFGFFQAIRLLERLRPDRAPVGGFDHPDREVARFGANTSVAFPASEIQTLDLDVEGPARVVVNFMGLNGPQGQLPLTYSLMVQDRERERDTALRDFLNLFNHRMLSLFYRAWEKTHFTVAHERDRSDPFTLHLLDLTGVGLEALRHRLPVPDETLIFYSGLLGIPSRPAVALERLLADHFAVPVTVEQFVGAWYPLDVPTQCELGDEASASSRLGEGAVVGDEIWDQQARIRVRIGPLPRARYDEFLPGGAAHEPLRALTRFFGNDLMDVDVQLVLARDEVPGCVLGADDESATPLGWCTWLRTAPLAHDPDETILTL